MATFRDLLQQTKARIREVTTAEGEQALADPKTVVLDVREPDEYDQGALPRAIHIPRGQLESNVENKIEISTAQSDQLAHVDSQLAAQIAARAAAQTASRSSATRATSDHDCVAEASRWERDPRRQPGRAGA